MFTWRDSWSIVLSDVIFGALSDMILGTLSDTIFGTLSDTIFGASFDVILVVFCYPWSSLYILLYGMIDYVEFLLSPLFPSSCLPWEQRVCGYGWLPVVTGG